MKTAIIAIATALVIAGNVEAKTYCAVSTSTKDANSYDKILANVEVKEQSFVLVAKDLGSAREINMADDLNTPEKWRALDGHQIVSFTKKDGQYSLILGKIEAGANSLYNFQAGTVGTIQDKGFLVLMAPAQKLSLSCYQAPN